MQRLEWTLVLLAALGLLGSGCSKRKASPGEASRGRGLALKPCPQGMLDDGEDANNQLVKQGGRDGFWFTYADSSGTTVEPEGDFKMSRGGPPGSSYAAHIHGRVGAQTKGQSPYAGVGFSLTHPKSAFDLSHSQGISFWAKGPGHLRVELPDVDTAPQGGHCQQCYNDFGKDFELSAEWARYAVRFDETTQQPNWGDHVSELATNAIYAVEWQVTGADSDFDVWVDNIELVGCE